MAITQNKKHDKCPVKAIKGPFGIHFGKLICKRHHKHIQWLSQADFKALVHANPNLYEEDGVKERPNRQKPKQKEIKMQRKYGNCWNTEYSFEL
jgi:hypothetical protein